MAGGRSKGQSEVTLGAGHVIGIFLGAVVLCGACFALGYFMGRGHGASRGAGSAAIAPVANADGDLTAKKSSPATPSWDFFPNKSGKNSSATPGLTPEKGPEATHAPAQRSGPIAMPAKPAHVRIDRKPPVLSSGRPGLSLQVAALRDRADAVSLAGFLKQKGYHAYAWGPGPGRLYRVQVGPYATPHEAQAAQKKLEREGFKSILRK
jgi:cell division septation protein DedD